MRQLDVYMNETKAGVLTEKLPGKGYTFCYCKDYLQTDLPTVSVTLPKREDEYESDELFPFFSNMMVEGAIRKAVCSLYRIDENDYFGLLAAMADKDCIGSVQLRKQVNDGDSG